MKPIYTVLLALLPLLSQAQGDMRVYTVAGLYGSTSSTPLGDGGPATAANLNATEGIWIDNAQNVYICDPVHYRIRKVNQTHWSKRLASS